MGSDGSITIRQIEGYRFEIDFGEAFPNLAVDEAPPYGGGEGPYPEQILVAGVTNCLCASLVFALGKFKQDATGLAARSSFRVERNADGRLRISGIEVGIALSAPAEQCHGSTRFSSSSSASVPSPRASKRGFRSP